MAIRVGAMVLLSAVMLASCGVPDPYQGHSAATRLIAASTTSAPRASSPREADGPRTPSPPPATGPALAATPQAALMRFAQLYVNWEATQLPDRGRELAAFSIGQARAQARMLAARAPALERHQVANAGTVVAIAAGQGQERTRWAVITNETTSGSGPYSGLPATSHVTWATVTHAPKGYVLSGWYPAS